MINDSCMIDWVVTFDNGALVDTFQMPIAQAPPNIGDQYATYIDATGDNVYTVVERLFLVEPQDNLERVISWQLKVKSQPIDA